MKKRYIVLLTALVLIIFIGIIQNTKNKLIKNESMSIIKQYEQFKKSKKPSIIVFSNYNGCCEYSTKCLEDFNKESYKLFEDYKTICNTLFVTAGSGIFLNIDEDKRITKIFKENDIGSVPSLIILDRNGNTVKVVETSINDKEIRKIIDGIVN